MSAVPSLTPWFPPAPAGTSPAKPLRAIGIVGTGKISSGIAQLCATKGLGVIMHDKEAGTLAHGVEVIRELFRVAEDRNEITHAAAHKAMGGIGITTSVEDLEFCDMVVEVITEDMISKRTRFVDFSRIMPKDAVLASCASAQGLEELYSVTAEPDRVIGLGFFDPVNTSPQVQVTIGSKTSRIATERVLGFITALGKTAIIQGDARPGV